MGIYDREYYRTSTRGFDGGTTPVLWGLIWANVIVYVLQLVTAGPQGAGLTNLLDLDAQSLLGQWQVWRLVTYGFCHDEHGLLHILFNMIVLFWAGNELERLYGPKEFLRFYLAGIVLSGLTYVALDLILKDNTHIIGASGGVMAVVALFACHYPTRKILLFFVIPVEVRWAALGLFIYDLRPVLLAIGGTPQVDQIAHAAHVGGLVYGFLYYYFDLRFGKLINRFRVVWGGDSKPVSKNRNLRAYVEPEPEKVESPSDRSPHSSAELRDRVDAILEKISAHGQESLNDEERRILIEASKKFRSRRGG